MTEPTNKELDAVITHYRTRIYPQGMQPHFERAIMRAVLAKWGTPQPTQPQAEATPHCPDCGTHEVSIHKVCHNSACSKYGAEVTVHKGWKTPPKAQPATACKQRPIAYVDGDDAVRRILWEPNQAAFDIAVGTKLYAYQSPADAVDAERYRWLRRWKGQEHEPPFTVQHEIDGTLWGGDLDAAIDAERASHGQAPAGAGMGHTDGGRNMFYEGRFDGESKREQQARLRWANDMRAAFERHTGNGWFDKDWRTETGLWSSAWHACLAAQPTTTAQAAPAAVAGPIGYGPKVTVRRSCSDCKVCNSESYAVQGDSGHYVYCEHPSLPERKYIGDTRWDTPGWCPAAAPTAQPAPVVQLTSEQRLAMVVEMDAHDIVLAAIDAEAAAAQPAPQQEAQQQEVQEPVAWQSRTRQTWGGDTTPWSPWELCTKGQAEDYWKMPLLHDWAYEARALYTAPQPAPATQQAGEVAEGFFLLLPQRPRPDAPAGTAGTAGLHWDAYSGAQMLAYGRDCSDAAIAAFQPSPAAQGDALDTLRLDWLDADESRCVFHLGKSWYTRPSYGLPYRKRASLREAIDAARAAQEGKSHDN